MPDVSTVVEANTFPPAAASYHVIVAPTVHVTVRSLNVCPYVTDCGDAADGMDTAAAT